MEKELHKLIQSIKVITGLSNEEIGKKIGYKQRTSFSRAKKDNPEGTISRLITAFKKELKDGDVTPDLEISSDILTLSASVKMLYEEVSELKAKKEKINPGDALEMMRKRTSSILKDLVQVEL